MNKGSSLSTKCHRKKKLKTVNSIDSENSSGCKKNDYDQEANALMYSNPGSICNLHEIEEDERRMSINAIRSELQIGLRKTYKKQREDVRRMSIDAIRSELQIDLGKTCKKQEKLLVYPEDKEPE